MAIGTIIFDVTEEVEGVLSLADSVTVSVLETGTVNQATLYEDITGASTVSNPFVSADGKVEIFADAGKRYDIVLTDGGNARTIPAVSVSTPASDLLSDGDFVGDRVENTAATGEVILDVGAIPADGTSNAIVRLFRYASTSGNKILQLLKGDGSADVATAVQVNSTADGVDVSGKVSMMGRVITAGTYLLPFQVAALRLWRDAGSLRVKDGSDPASATDGTLISPQLLQLQQAYSDTADSTTSATYVVMGDAQTITPTTGSSKLFAFFNGWVTADATSNGENQVGSNFSIGVSSDGTTYSENFVGRAQMDDIADFGSNRIRIDCPLSALLVFDQTTLNSGNWDVAISAHRVGNSRAYVQTFRWTFVEVDGL